MGESGWVPESQQLPCSLSCGLVTPEHSRLCPGRLIFLVERDFLKPLVVSCCVECVFARDWAPAAQASLGLKYLVASRGAEESPYSLPGNPVSSDGRLVRVIGEPQSDELQRFGGLALGEEESGGPEPLLT